MYKEHLSYSEEQQSHAAIRHLFFPNPLGLIIEGIFATALLVLICLGTINKTLESTVATDTNPVAYTTELSANFWMYINSIDIVRQASLFVLWALFGMVLYVVGFKLIQFVSTSVFSVKNDVDFIMTDHSRGMKTLLIQIQVFLSKTLILISGVSLVIIGVTVCFAYAISQTKMAVAVYPDNLAAFGIGLVAAFIGMRLFMIGLCFLVPSFRRWYDV